MKIRWHLCVVLVLTVCFLSLTGLAFAADFGGRKVRLGYVVDLGERHFSEPEEQAHLEQIADEFNAEIEFVITQTDIVEYLAPQVMAGDAEVDVLLTANEWGYKAALEGFLYPLDDYMTEEYWEALPPIAVREIHRSPADGHFYTFRAHHMYTHYFLNNQVIIWNKSLFEREGLPDLHELWKNGEWTWDAFMDIAENATRDTDGDGELDQWGFTNSNHRPHALPGYLLTAFAASNNAQAIRRADGRVEFAMDDPAMIETLEFIREIYYEKEVAYPPLQINSANIEAFTEGNLAMLLSNTWRLTGWKDEMEDDYALVPVPMGPRADEHKVVSTHKLAFAIPIVVDHDPGDLIELTHALFRVSEDYIIEDTWEEEIERWNEPLVMAMRDDTSYEVQLWADENWEPALGFDDYYIPGFNDLVVEIIEEGTSASSAVDAIKPAAQTHIDDLFN